MKLALRSMLESSIALLGGIKWMRTTAMIFWEFCLNSEKHVIKYRFVDQKQAKALVEMMSKFDIFQNNFFIIIGQ